MKRVPTSDAAFFSVGWCLTDAVEVTLELAKDPVGSRFVQFRYAHPADANEQEFIAKVLLDDFLGCAKHACGNYTVQCLLSGPVEWHAASAVDTVSKHLLALSTNVYGHRVVQKALDVAADAAWSKLVQSVVSSMPAFVQHQCAHNVVQKMLSTVSLRESHATRCFMPCTPHEAALSTHSVRTAASFRRPCWSFLRTLQSLWRCIRTDAVCYSERWK